MSTFPVLHFNAIVSPDWKYVRSSIGTAVELTIVSFALLIEFTIKFSGNLELSGCGQPKQNNSFNASEWFNDN